MSQEWSSYPVTRKFLPHQHGAKRLTAQYGHRLVCVRYRNDIARQRKITTVEIVVDERPWTPIHPPRDLDAILSVAIAYHETDLRNAVKAAGGIWDARNKVWKLAYRAIKALKLIDRIVADQSEDTSNE